MDLKIRTTFQIQQIKEHRRHVYLWFAEHIHDSASCTTYTFRKGFCINSYTKSWSTGEILSRYKYGCNDENFFGLLNDIIEINPLNVELNPICYLLALLGAHHFLHVSRIRVKSLTLRLLMSYIYIYIYIYGAPILDVSRSHTTTHHSR